MLILIISKFVWNQRRRRDIHKCPACKELMDRIHDFEYRRLKVPAI